MADDQGRLGDLLWRVIFQEGEIVLVAQVTEEPDATWAQLGEKHLSPADDSAAFYLAAPDEETASVRALVEYKKLQRRGVVL